MEPNVFWNCREGKKPWEDRFKQQLLNKAKMMDLTFHYIAGKYVNKDDDVVQYLLANPPKEEAAIDDAVMYARANVQPRIRNMSLIVLGPHNMRADKATSKLLLTCIGYLTIPVHIHWDGQQFWLYPDDWQREGLIEYLSKAKKGKKYEKARQETRQFYGALLPMMGKWINESDWYNSELIFDRSEL